MENFFENIKEAPADPILGLTQAYKVRIVEERTKW